MPFYSHPSLVSTNRYGHFIYDFIAERIRLLVGGRIWIRRSLYRYVFPILKRFMINLSTNLQPVSVLLQLHFSFSCIWFFRKVLTIYNWPRMEFCSPVFAKLLMAFKSLYKIRCISNIDFMVLLWEEHINGVGHDRLKFKNPPKRVLVARSRTII